MISRPRATSSRTCSGVTSSRSATRRIGPVISPWRAKNICLTQSMKKLGKLAYDDRVAAIARAHSEDMAAGRERLGHAGFKDRAKAVDRMTPYDAIAENVALNDYSRTRTVAVAVQGWLHSPHHLENIAGEYDHTGVGVARAADGTFYYTQLFVSRRR